ncbi:hypothetical protein HCU40_07420 [Pseudanabaena biceps]|nr:hypothetical protein [Pseudanabaena biceps]
MTIGNYKIVTLTNSSETFTGSEGQIILGLSGNDQLTASSLGGIVGPTVLAGGLGADTYIAPSGTSSIIIENGGTIGDVLRFGFSFLKSGQTASQVTFAQLDNRHLYIFDPDTRTSVVIIDWKVTQNRVNTFSFIDQDVSFDFISKNLTAFPNYRGNFAIQQTNPNVFSYLSPSTGLTPTSFNSAIADISQLAKTPAPTPAPNLGTPIQRFQNTALPGTFIFAGASEAANIRANFTNFKEEGFAFNVGNQGSDPLLQPLFRFQNSAIPGTYLFAGAAEAANIRTNFKNFIEEGIAFSVYSAGSGIGTQYNRFQNSARPGTFIFASVNESASILSNNKEFVLEGAAFNVG